MRHTRALVLAVLLVLPLTCSAGSSGEMSGESASGRIVITAGTTAGVYYAWALALKEQLEATSSLEVEVLPSSGSIENLARLTAGTADLAVSAGDAAETRNGRGSADDESSDVPLRAIARIYDDYYHVIVPAGSTLHSLSDLAGHRVAIGDPGSGTALIARRLLSLAGITVQEKELGIVDGLDALKAGTVDAVFWSGGVPTTAVQATSEQIPLRLIGLGDLAREMRFTYGSVYRPAAIPAGRYGGNEQVDTMALANLLVTRADADDEMVSTVISTIFDRRSAIARDVPAANQTDLRSAILTGGLDLHPAAVAYYRKEKL
ncbi:TAXI family TRAP transporter solute-binding subunit [Kineosporia sp. J2-2]|uniref:TAXI family TRAP transporter solute-binding subunit n=1 Tax=Kineosporia corallincola TaxID=2835133 RepID=A0ABS5TSU7_9ACTN|nr:TAXI family TRAP transporter solute-binding subunit [Kineosporia corallincola]MBT0773856.1 TAXI family TRAP transporter solute-binding subunit [Kineosporia corallincola]